MTKPDQTRPSHTFASPAVLLFKTEIRARVHVALLKCDSWQTLTSALRRELLRGCYIRGASKMRRGETCGTLKKDSQSWALTLIFAIPTLDLRMAYSAGIADARRISR